MTLTPDRQHFRRLDGVRGVAILMVLAFHCFGLTYDRWQLPWQPDGWLATTAVPHGHLPVSFLILYPVTFGWAGVALFFVLSGFVIHHAQVRAGPFSPTTFAWRRACRIYPPYLLALVYFGARLWWRAGADRHAVGRQMAAHLLLLHNLRPDTYGGVNGSFWSLAVEAQFYALYPVLLLARRWGGTVAPLLLSAAVSAGAWAMANRHTDWRHATLLPTFVWWNTLPLWFSWALGMFLADRFAAGRRVFARPAVWGVAFAVFFVAATFAKPTWTLAFTLSAAAGMVAIEAALWSPRYVAWLGNRWLVAVGLCSYSFYLWHQPLLPSFVRYLHLYRLSPAVQFPLLLATSVGLIGGFSWVMYLTVERPSQWAAKRFAPRRPA